MILLRHSNRNKIKILDRSFIWKELILTYPFIRSQSLKFFYVHNLQWQKTMLILNTGAESDLIGILCPPWKQSMLMSLCLTGDRMKLPNQGKLFKVSNHHRHYKGHHIPSYLHISKICNYLGTWLQDPTCSSNWEDRLSSCGSLSIYCLLNV